MRFSVILTAAREQNTITKAISCLVDKNYSGVDWADGELLIIAPDDITLKTAKDFLNKQYAKIKYKLIQDPYVGKPTALNLGFENACGKYLMLTDGDVFLAKHALSQLIESIEKDTNIGGITGRPVAIETKDKFWGYIANLLADAAHHKRLASMRRDVGGKSLNLVKKGPGFFVLSGYIAIIKNLNLRIPADTLVDDAYLSYLIVNQGLEISYNPEAKVFVKYPNNLNDWYKQKVRAVGGYMQLYKYDIIKKGKKVRNFWKEVEYFWFPIAYAKNIKHLFWSLALYPLRFVLWLQIFFKQRVLKKEVYQGWERVESTK